MILIVNQTDLANDPHVPFSIQPHKVILYESCDEILVYELKQFGPILDPFVPVWPVWTILDQLDSLEFMNFCNFNNFSKLNLLQINRQAQMMFKTYILYFLSFDCLKITTLMPAQMCLLSISIIEITHWITYSK